MTKAIDLNKFFSTILLFIFTFLLFSFPVFAFAQEESSTTKGKGGLIYECAGIGGRPGECTWQDLIAAIQKAVDWGAVLAISLSVVVIAYAGFIYMTSGGSPSERTKANKMFQKVGIGIFAIMCAWLIVNLITSSLLKDSLKDVFN